MAQLSSSELRDDTEAVLGRVAAGERLEITVNGKTVAQLLPPERPRSYWIKKTDLISRLGRIQVDPGLTNDLAALNTDGGEPGPIR